MKKIIILITLITSCIWAFDIKNLSDCTVSEKHDVGSDDFTIKCQSPAEYEIHVDIRWHELDEISEYVYTENGKKTDALFFDPEGGAHHQISEQDEYGVYVSINNQIISCNKLNKLLMKKWEYFKKLKRQIESNNTDTTETNEYMPDGGWYSDNNNDEEIETKQPTYEERRIAQIMEKYK